jgi:GH35 family endo-1,4-beta-xylanase
MTEKYLFHSTFINSVNFASLGFRATNLQKDIFQESFVTQLYIYFKYNVIKNSAEMKNMNLGQNMRFFNFGTPEARYMFAKSLKHFDERKAQLLKDK